jgi:hypothetical protein
LPPSKRNDSLSIERGTYFALYPALDTIEAILEIKFLEITSLPIGLSPERTVINERKLK